MEELRDHVQKTMSTPTGYFVAVNVGIGTGIAADAMLATVARARSLGSSKDAVKWAAAIGLTHWLFPMAGFLGGWYLASHGVASAFVYGVGGGVLLCYVVQVLRERCGLTRGEDHEVSNSSFWLAVWGVSVDALVTGPGKAAATADWTPAQVAVSFPLVGVVVFVLVLVSTVPAMALHERLSRPGKQSWKALAVFFSAATWVEVLVFTWFAMLSFVEASGALKVITPSYTLASGCAALVVMSLVSIAGRRVWKAQADAARKLVLT